MKVVSTGVQARALLLDLDGTLADTAPDLGGALNRLLIRHGRLPLTFAEYRPLAGHGSVALLHAGFGISRDDSEFEALRKEWLDEYERHICQHTALFPDMQLVLQTVESNAMKWGVATNKPDALTQPLMRALGLRDRSSVTISGDTVARAKPAPDMLLAAAASLGVAPQQCLYVGDARRDIEAARAAAMPCLAASWGYIEHDDSIEDWRADAVIADARSILQYLMI